MLRLFAILAATALLAALVTIAESHGVGLRGVRGGGYLPQIHGVTFGTPWRYNSQWTSSTAGACCWVTGDGYQTAWATGDSNLYTNIKDTTYGWNGADPGSNVAIAKINGYNEPFTGFTVNTMQGLGFFNTPGSDSGSSKMSGMMFVGGQLYAQYYRGITAKGSTIMKSGDKGLTWTPLPPGCTSNTVSAAGCTSQIPPLMWPTTGNPYIPLSWVYYPEPDYPPTQPQDQVDGNATYLYANWADQQASLPHHLFLSRVQISALPALSASDWQWYTGPAGGDGINTPGNWGSYTAATPLITLPVAGSWPGAGCGNSSANASAVYDVQWLPYYQQYMAIAYSNVQPVANTINCWALYTAPHPWGPWTPLQTNTWSPSAPYQGLYDPSIVAQSVATDGGRTFMTFSAGDYLKQDPSQPQPAGYYCVWATSATVN